MQKKCRELHSQHAIHESVRFGILLAIVGGFLDAYTFVGRGGVFANAQTGNIVLLGIYASEGEWRQALVHVPPILACVIGVIVVGLLCHGSSVIVWIHHPKIRLLAKTSSVVITSIITLKTWSAFSCWPIISGWSIVSCWNFRTSPITLFSTH